LVSYTRWGLGLLANQINRRTTEHKRKTAEDRNYYHVSQTWIPPVFRDRRWHTGGRFKEVMSPVGDEATWLRHAGRRCEDFTHVPPDAEPLNRAVVSAVYHERVGDRRRSAARMCRHPCWMTGDFLWRWILTPRGRLVLPVGMNHFGLPRLASMQEESCAKLLSSQRWRFFVGTKKLVLHTWDELLWDSSLVG
jgi:hypothetical protein